VRNTSPAEEPARPLVVGVIGGIGSGKSAVCQAAAQLTGGWVIDADRLGHNALTDGEIQKQLLAQFGPRILNSDNTISRSALAALVFGHQGAEKESRRQLEAIVHPWIAGRVEQVMADAISQSIPIVYLDAAILLEAGWADQCDYVVFIDTPRELRLSRIAAQRGWSAEELTRRESSQWSLERKARAADAVIPNDADIPSAAVKLGKTVDQLRLSAGTQ
jgi:dephospho-CoA kinase